jgi:hypothetical protein
VLKPEAREEDGRLAFENKEKRGTYRTEREKDEEDKNYMMRRFIKCSFNEIVLQ